MAEPSRHLSYIALDDLPSALVNPKLHDPDLIEASVSRFGFMEIPVVDERTGRLVAGHGRRDQLLAMRDAGAPPPEGIEVDAEGRWLVPTVRGWSSADDNEAHAAGIALNRGAEAGGWDDRALTDLLREINDSDPLLGLTGTGYDPMVLANLVMVTRTAAEVASFDAAAEWVGMPDYEAEQVPWKMTLSFASLDDRDTFLDQYGLRDQVTFTHADGRVVSAFWPRREHARHDTGLRWEDPDADPLGVWEPAEPLGVGGEKGGPDGSPDGQESGLDQEAGEPTGGDSPAASAPAHGPLSGSAPRGLPAEGEGDGTGEGPAHGLHEPVATP